jgi:hypothetical protein
MLPVEALEGLFAALMLWVAVSMARRREPSERRERVGGGGNEPSAPEPAIEVDRPPTAPVTFTDRLGGADYKVRRLPVGMLGSVGAGLVSALLGVGGGIIKVPLMHLVLGVPLRISTATSNMMIGVTATSSAVIYLLRGEIDPFVAGPTAVGVFLGASLGSRVSHRIDVRILRWLFVLVLLYTAFEMTRKALGI